MAYFFETRYFALSDDNLHWLREGFNYKSESLENIIRAEVKPGTAIQNSFVVRIIGLALVAFAAYYFFGLYKFFASPGYERIKIEMIVLPVLPLLIGVYCLYVSFKPALVLKVTYGKSKVDTFPLTELEQAKNLPALNDFLKQKLGSRFDNRI